MSREDFFTLALFGMNLGFFLGYISRGLFSHLEPIEMLVAPLNLLATIVLYPHVKLTRKQDG